MEAETRSARSHRWLRRRRRRLRRVGRASQTLRALTSGALALPGLTGAANADTPVAGVVTDYSFSLYREDDLPAGKVTPGGTRSRYEIQVHQAQLAAPIGDRLQLGIDVVHEVMSGASPWYVIPDADGDPIQVMTGATIEDQRTDVRVNGRYFFDDASAALTAGISRENDYLAFSGEIAGEKQLGERGTTISSGLGVSFDKIEPTDAGPPAFPLRPKSENKSHYSIFAGVTQILDRASIVQSTASFRHARGFLSDPYKRALVAGTPAADSRPDSRNLFALLTRYRRHFESINGTIHADYRFYIDDWKLSSHTVELAWYQGFWEFLRIIPSVRYYTQSQAEFYAPYYASARNDGYHSSDYRLSPYGALAWRVRAETDFRLWGIGWRANASYERYISAGDLALGKVAVENPGLVSFGLLSFGIGTSF